jgi:hypothetical protein
MARMRFAIRISRPWRSLFSLFGFRASGSYVELDGEVLRLRFGTADETIPLAHVDGVSRRAWPLWYGLGPKLGPERGVAYVGSREGVVQIRLSQPHAMNVWGPFSRARAHAITVSLEDPDGFIAAVDRARQP